jgi:hypothetical protein
VTTLRECGTDGAAQRAGPENCDLQWRLPDVLTPR